jgi:hypothetical protein
VVIDKKLFEERILKGLFPHSLVVTKVADANANGTCRATLSAKAYRLGG